jgi:NAD-dependent DNA ligase
LVDDHTREKISHNGKRISPETKGVIVDDHTIIKKHTNVLPLFEGVIVDDHTREKISHSGKRISPSTSSRVIFFFQSVIFPPSCGHLL